MLHKSIFLFSEKLVEHELKLNYVFRGEFEVSGSLAEEVDKITSPLELVYVIDLKLEVGWTESAFRTVIIEDCEDMCTTG